MKKMIPIGTKQAQAKNSRSYRGGKGDGAEATSAHQNRDENKPAAAPTIRKCGNLADHVDSSHENI